MMREPILLCAIACVVTYFVCGIPFGLLVASIGHGVDVRKVGSGNIGTTNVARSAGAGAAALTLLLDAGKGYLCTFFAPRIFSKIIGMKDLSAFAPSATLGWMAAWIFLACIVGHIFSCYLGFRGGKGIAVGLGGALGISWAWGLTMLSVFIVIVALTRYVSAGSICAAASLPVLAFAMLGAGPSFLLPACLVSAVVIWAHRENIDRLLKGEERKLEFKRKEG